MKSNVLFHLITIAFISMTSHNTLRFVTANINCSCLGIGWYALDEIYLNCLYVIVYCKRTRIDVFRNKFITL